MWHASVGVGPGYGRALLRRIVRQTLDGVGDASRGEWVEYNARAYHLRRRLSVEEEAVIGPAVDIRGSDEHRQRWDAIRPALGPRILAALALAPGELPR